MKFLLDKSSKNLKKFAIMGRKLVIIRHGERVDYTFDTMWIKECFNEKGEYTKNNLNLPDTLPKRVGSPDTFLRDSPLTQVGNFQAQLVGQGLKEEGVLKEGSFELFASPSLRSVETARSIIKGMDLTGDKVPPMKIEPCLFEWVGWYPGEMKPDFLTIREFQDYGIRVDASYKPFMTQEEVLVDETVQRYYERSFELVKHLLTQTPEKDLLLVGHGSTLDCATRQLVGHAPRFHSELLAVLRGIPYCAVAIAEENNGNWAISRPPRSLYLRHSTVNDFDAYIALSK